MVSSSAFSLSCFDVARAHVLFFRFCAQLWRRRQLQELKHGRLASLGITGDSLFSLAVLRNRRWTLWRISRSTSNED